MESKSEQGTKFIRGTSSCKFHIKVILKYFQGFPFRFLTGGGILPPPLGGGGGGGGGGRVGWKGKV